MKKTVFVPFVLCLLSVLCLCGWSVDLSVILSSVEKNVPLPLPLLDCSLTPDSLPCIRVLSVAMTIGSDFRLCLMRSVCRFVGAVGQCSALVQCISVGT